jgi:hypothetical protein
MTPKMHVRANTDGERRHNEEREHRRTDQPPKRGGGSVPRYADPAGKVSDFAGDIVWRGALSDLSAERPRRMPRGPSDETHLSGAIRPWSPDRRCRPARFQPSAFQGMASPNRPSSRWLAWTPRCSHYGRLWISRNRRDPLPSTSRIRPQETSSRRRAPVALFDYDNDGRIDIFIPNGTTIDGAPGGPMPDRHQYRNLGGLRFDDVTTKAGLLERINRRVRR